MGNMGNEKLGNMGNILKLYEGIILIIMFGNMEDQSLHLC